MPDRSPSTSAPSPLPSVTAQQAHALAGDMAESFAFGTATVVIGGTGTVILVEAGDTLGESGVWNADEVRLLGPAPTPVRKRLMEEPWAQGTHEAALPVHLVVLVPEGLVRLGTGSVARAATELRPGETEHVLTSCALRLHSPLRKADLDRVRPPLPRPDLPSLEWLAHVDDDRATALEQFVTGWYPVVPEAPEPPSMRPPALDLPEELRQFHRLARQRPRAMGVQNRILAASARLTDPLGEMLVLGEENQGGFYWSVPWTLEGAEADPVVWFREYDEPPIAEQEPLSGFLLQFSLYEAAMGADYLALPRRLTARQADRITAGLLPVPLRPFWPGAPTRFYVGPGLVLHISDEGDDDGDGEGDGARFSAWAGALHRSALAPLADAPVEWTRFDG